MIKGLWNKTTFFCCYRHPVPIPMKINQRGETPFYACPHYYQKEEAHPDGREEGEPACPNRMSTQDAEKILDMFSDIILNDKKTGVMRDYTNMRLKYQAIDFVILDYNSDHLYIGILNKRALV